MIGKVYPWLLPAIVTLVLVLSFAGAERVRRNTTEGKFNRIQLGMNPDRVCGILGPPLEGARPAPGSFSRKVWLLEDLWITVDFDKDERVYGKSLGHIVDGSGNGLAIGDRESAP